MAKIIHKCPTCSKAAETKSEMTVGSLKIRTYECGHVETFLGMQQSAEDTLDIMSLDGKRPFKYQLEGGQFFERSNLRALCADEMGLGKTVQAAITLKAHNKRFVIFCKKGLKLQWFKELIRWGDFVCQVIEGTNADLLPGFDGYIISMDSSWRIGKKAVKRRAPGGGKNEIYYEPIPGKSLEEQLLRCKVDTVVVDECQLIKNIQSERTVAITKVCKQMEHVLGLSGTPIKNNAGEYFPILNILRPDKFPNQTQFLTRWCDSYSPNGGPAKIGGLKDPQRFLEFTKDFIIRRERKDVLPDLPSIFRQFQFCDLGEVVEDEYKKTLKEFNDYYDSGGEGDSGLQKAANLLAYISKMRHLTGLAKVEPVIEFVDDFIMTTDRKIMLFVHHKDVGFMLKTKLENRGKEWPAEWGKGILEITSEMSPEQCEDAVEKFRSNDYRIMIGSTLASGEGLNLQFCADCIMVERQWNPANEEQAEARFPRPGQTADKINATYFVAVGTVDEFFSTLVERKREICNAAYSGEATPWNQASLMGELAEVLRQKGGQKWGW